MEAGPVSGFGCRSVLAGLLLTALVGCATTTEERSPDVFSAADGVEEDVLITIQNNDFRDATLYAYWNGVKDRVGMVIGKTSETFRMEWRSEVVHFEVNFIGRGGFRTEPIDVWEGDHLDFVIPVGR
jgi:hypothetical protein